MEAYVADLNENLWDDSISQTISDMPHEMQSDAECAEIVKEMLSSDISYVRKAGSGNDDEVESVSYSLRCKGSEFGVITLTHDISKEDDVKTLVSDVEEKYGQIDALVNTAGICGSYGEILACRFPASVCQQGAELQENL